MGQLLSQNCNNNNNDEERLLIACDEGRYHQVASLLKQHSVNVNCIDAFTGDTPIFKAVRHAVFFEGNLPIVECLLQHGADVNAIDRGKSTPLHWACVYRRVELVRLLVHYGANVHVRDALEQTPLHKAHDCLPIVEFLIQTCHANPHNVDCFGLDLADRLTHEIQDDLEAREFNNQRDDCTRHAQQVLEYLQNLSTNTENYNKPAALSIKVTLVRESRMAHVPKHATVNKALGTNDYISAPRITTTTTNNNNNYTTRRCPGGSRKPGLERQSARIMDSSQIMMPLTEQERQSENKSHELFSPKRAGVDNSAAAAASPWKRRHAMPSY